MDSCWVVPVRIIYFKYSVCAGIVMYWVYASGSGAFLKNANVDIVTWV